jgi:hypothetical protein
MSTIPSFVDYRLLARIQHQTEERALTTGEPTLMEVLNRCGATLLTVCPACRLDDFQHAEQCALIRGEGEP